MDNSRAKDISYAASAQSAIGSQLIRVIENATGRAALIKRAQGYDTQITQGRDFWEVIADRYGVTLDVVSGTLENIPKSGPLVLVANHPFGILDGLALGLILARWRGDFRILANTVFQKVDALEQSVLPISFDQDKGALLTNLATRKTALNYLTQGGAIGVFPGGTVSTAQRPFGAAKDPAWRSFTSRMIMTSNATVIPVFFQGSTSRLFQIASHIHPNLRLALLIREFGKRVDTPVRVAIGQPIGATELARLRNDPREMMDFLRRSTYELSPTPQDTLNYGYEFDQRYKVLQ